MEQFQLTAQKRMSLSQGASRRMRAKGQVPAIIYGASKAPVPITLDHNELSKNLEHEAFYSHILTINIEGQSEKAILKDLQRHPYRPFILHVDLQRVSETEKITIRVPLHFINEERCVGVKQGGGIISRQLIEVSIRCLPKDLPEFIEVDVAELNLNETLHLSDLKLPAGVELEALQHGGAEDVSVVSVHSVRGGSFEGEHEGEAGA
jgi:large subunit ribosomal protein L25